MRQGSKQQKSDRHSATGVVQPNPVVTLGMGGTQKQVHMAKTNGDPTNQPNPRELLGGGHAPAQLPRATRVFVSHGLQHSRSVPSPLGGCLSIGRAFSRPVSYFPHAGPSVAQAGPSVAQSRSKEKRSAFHMLGHRSPRLGHRSPSLALFTYWAFSRPSTHTVARASSRSGAPECLVARAFRIRVCPGSIPVVGARPHGRAGFSEGGESAVRGAGIQGAGKGVKRPPKDTCVRRGEERGGAGRRARRAGFGEGGESGVRGAGIQGAGKGVKRPPKDTCMRRGGERRGAGRRARRRVRRRAGGRAGGWSGWQSGRCGGAKKAE